jgi:hypothetical protein
LTPGTTISAPRNVLPWFSALALLLGACGESPTPPPERLDPGISLASGALSDTVQSEPSAALVFRVAGPDGLARAGVVVRFEPVPVQVAGFPVLPVEVSRAREPNFRGLAVDTTDRQGRASVRVRAGTGAGPAQIRVSVPEFGYQKTITYTVLPGSASRVVAEPRDTAVFSGNSLVLRAWTVDLFGNARADAVSFAALSGPVAVQPNGTATAGDRPSRAAVVARSGALADTVYLSVVPPGWLAVQSFDPGNGGPRGFVMLQVDGSEHRTVAPGLDNRVAPKGFGWSADGEALFVPRESRIHRIERNGGETTVREFAGPVTSVRPSRDGAWIYFTVADRTWQNASLYRMRPDGTGPERITSPPYGRSEYGSSPSPDGRHLAFVSNAGGGRVHVWDLAGAHDTGVSLPGRAVAWSPVAAEIAYHDGERLRVIRPDGSPLRDLGAIRGEPTTIDWSPDGNWIVISFVWGAPVTVVDARTGLHLPLGYAASMGEAAWGP